jgi:HlyD family secretion protein
MMIFRQRVVTLALLLSMGASALFIEGDRKGGVSFVASAHAQFIHNLIAHLRGATLPDGILKSNGRLDATQVDVSSKYPGRLSKVTVEEGSDVAKGQVIAVITSPEYEAQLSAAKADVQKANDALAAAEAEITTRQSALEFAKADFERGEELIKTGTITQQDYDRRKRNYDAAVAAVQTFTSQRDQVLAQIANSEAEVDRVQSKIDDLTLVSPRLGRVQYKLHYVGEVVEAGAPIVTILDLTDMYMTMFLASADASRLRVGEEARIILDPVPDYVIPATISFVATEAEFTPQWVEITNQRTDLMFRVKLQIDPQLLKEFSSRMKTGVLGLGFVRTDSSVQWPEDLQVKLPKPPETNATDIKPLDAPPSNDK